MKQKLLILVILMVTHLAGASVISLRAQATPVPSATTSLGSVDYVSIEITASHHWVFEQSEGKCRLNVPASGQVLEVILDAGDSLRFPVPRGILTSENECFIQFTVSLDESQSYLFKIHGNLVAMSDGTGLIQSDPDIVLVFEPSGAPTPTPIPPTPVPTPTPEATPPPLPAGKQDNGMYLLRLSITTSGSHDSGFYEACAGTDSLEFIIGRPPVQVILRDGNDTIIGIGVLVDSSWSESNERCYLTYEIEVQQFEFYQVTITGYADIIYQFEQLEEYGWSLIFFIY